MLNREEFEDQFANASSQFQEFSDRLGEIAAHLGQTEYEDYVSENFRIFSGDLDNFDFVVRYLGQWSDWMESIAHEW